MDLSMHVFPLLGVLQDTEPWGMIVFLSTLLMLFVSLVITHIPLKWLNKIPTILHGMFLLPFLVYFVVIFMDVSEVQQAILSREHPDIPTTRELEVISEVYYVAVCLGLYALMPFWFAFRSMVAMYDLQKVKEWREGVLSIAPSLGVWSFITCLIGIVWLVTEPVGWGVGFGLFLVLSFTAIVPFSSLTQHQEGGDKLAFFSNYLGVLALWVWFFAVWGFEIHARVVTVMMYPDSLTTYPFGMNATIVISCMILLSFCMLVYYALKMRGEKLQALLVTLFSFGLFSAMFIMLPEGEPLVQSFLSTNTQEALVREKPLEILNLIDDDTGEYEEIKTFSAEEFENLDIDALEKEGNTLSEEFENLDIEALE